MFWQWVLQLAVRAGKADWAKAKYEELAKKQRDQVGAQANAMAKAAGVPPPPPLVPARVSQIIKTDADVLKIGQKLTVNGRVVKVTRLLSASAREVIYEADVL